MVMTKTAPMNKTQAAAWIKNYFHQIQSLYNQPNSPTTPELEKILSHNFQFSSNGHMLGRTAADYLNRMLKLRKKYSHFEIKGPSEEPLMHDNHMAVHYDLLCRAQNGQTAQINIMALATMEDNKMASWVQVAHEKGAGHWDN